MDEALLARARQIQLVAMDVDGVLTTGEITYTSSGEEIKAFNVKDGLGISLAHRAGLKTAIITARQSPMVDRRARELAITDTLQHQKDKRAGVELLAEKYGLGLHEIAYMGDDLPDLTALEVVGLACCPADAVALVQQACHFVSQHGGGRGAVRELIDMILVARG